MPGDTGGSSTWTEGGASVAPGAEAGGAGAGAAAGTAVSVVSDEAEPESDSVDGACDGADPLGGEAAATAAACDMGEGFGCAEGEVEGEVDAVGQGCPSALPASVEGSSTGRITRWVCDVAVKGRAEGGSRPRRREVGLDGRSCLSDKGSSSRASSVDCRLVRRRAAATSSWPSRNSKPGSVRQRGVRRPGERAEGMRADGMKIGTSHSSARQHASGASAPA